MWLHDYYFLLYEPKFTQEKPANFIQIQSW